METQQESRLRKNIFKYWEAERKRMAEVLQEDIAQLVAIAKIKLSESNATEVEACLTIALKRLRKLSFDIKPQILEHFGLAAALQELINYHTNEVVSYHVSRRNDLPADMDSLMAVAIFRIMQDVLENLTALNLQSLSFEISRDQNFICIKNTIAINPITNGSASPKLTEQMLTRDIVHVMYLFNGEATFLFHNDHEVEMTIRLTENNSH